MKSRLTGERWVVSDEKRALDIVMASSLLPIATTIGVAALGLSRVIDGEGALFRQERLGQNRKTLIVNKVRTMKDASANADGSIRKEVTRLGRVLRPLAIDEIPQLANVLEGSMSMVGPRVITENAMAEVQQATDRNLYDEWLEAYYASRPGGFSSNFIEHRLHGNSHAEQSLIQRAQLDIEDFKNASLQYDLGIMKKAVGVGLALLLNRGEQIYSPDWEKIHKEQK